MIQLVTATNDLNLIKPIRAVILQNQLYLI